MYIPENKFGKVLKKLKKKNSSSMQVCVTENFSNVIRINVEGSIFKN